jgi:hypothetical protein
MSTRQTEAQNVISVSRVTVRIECLNCCTVHTLDRADGMELEQQPCHADDCTAMLCKACDQFKCERCELAHCASHVKEFAGMKLCPVCHRATVDEAALEFGI